MIAATQESVAQAVEVLCAASDRDGTSIRNLSERMTHESLAILELLGEMRDKLDPAYARVFPEFGRFTDEVDAILKRRPKT